MSQFLGGLLLNNQSPFWALALGGAPLIASFMKGHVQANRALWSSCIGSPNPSTRATAPSGTPLKLALCEYRLTAAGVSRTGTGAMFLDFGPTKMITFPEGQIAYTGSGKGTFPVGASRGAGDNQGATLTINFGAGTILPLSSADGGSTTYRGRPVQYPPAANLTVVHVDSSEIEGWLDGTFFVSGMAAGGPAMFTHVPAVVEFRAAAATGVSSCVPMQ